MDIYDVNEMFSRYYVDPDIAQQNVPSKWKVKIHDNGKAVLLGFQNPHAGAFKAMILKKDWQRCAFGRFTP